MIPELMLDQATNRAQVDKAWSGIRAAAGRLGLILDAATRLGPRPVLLRLGDAALRGVARARLGDRAAPARGFFPRAIPPAPVLPRGAAERVLAAARALPEAPDWHLGFDPALPALAALRSGRGARAAWEPSRLAALPTLVQAARLDPGGWHLARAEALLAAWCTANPPFRGIAWACGQEAAFRALHLALALALLEADRDPPPGARGLLALCARRIAATPLYALAQDNNHPVSEAAGAFVCALLLGEDTRRAASRLAALVARLVAPDGGFAQVSPGYARAALDTLAVVEWLRRRHGVAPFPAPFAERAAALCAWLHRVTEPATGGAPRLGLEDDAAIADLSLSGPRDARGSVERAARLFAGCGADAPEDPGCAWLGLARPAVTLARPARWSAAGTAGWEGGGAAAVLRTGPLRFRPSQCDLLHLSLRDGAGWVIRDGGTGSYDPPAAWWMTALWGAAAHNAPVFDAAEPMPRAGRFLLAGWPRIRPRAEGAALRDRRGNGVERAVAVAGRSWTVTDRLSGPFREVAWHWRLSPGAWRIGAGEVAGPAARLRFEADAPLRLALLPGWESAEYGAIGPVPVVRVAAAAPVGWMRLTVDLPDIRG